MVAIVFLNSASDGLNQATLIVITKLLTFRRKGNFLFIYGV